MPLSAENAGNVTWTDITAAGQSRPAALGRAKGIRSVYVVADFAVLMQTAAVGLASPAEVLELIQLSYDVGGATKMIEVHGPELHNISLGFYKTQGVYPQLGTGGSNLSIQPFSVAGATTENITFRGMYRIPVGAPESDKKLNITVTLAGSAVWVVTTADINTASGTVYFFADQAPFDTSYSSWHDRVIAQSTTIKEEIPAVSGSKIIGISLVIRKDSTSWVAGTEVNNTRATNYLDRLTVLEVKNAEQIYRYDTPLAFVLHSSRYLGLIPQGVANAGTTGTLKSYPNGCYWVEMDSQAPTSNFRVKFATSTSVDVDFCTWFGDAASSAQLPEIKVDGPTPGATASSVPVNAQAGMHPASARGGATRIARR